MKLFHKPFGHYLRQTRWGMGVLLAVAIVRFLMLPLFQVPYEQGTHWVSLTELLPILMLVYAVVVARAGGTFRDLLAIALCLAFSSALLVILGIGFDDFGGVDTYFTVGETGPSPAGPHMLVHAVEGLVFTLLLWGLGSLTYVVAGGRRRSTAPDDSAPSTE